jgi:VWFA-related protein
MRAVARGARRRVVSGAAVRAIVAASLVPAVIAAAALARPRASQERQPTFAVSVELVTTDVIPRDEAGRFVADLTRDDFEVLEDGVRQDIVSFVLVHGGRTFNLVRPTPPPAPEGIVLPSAPPPPDVAGRVFLIVADDLHLQAQDTPHVRKVLKQIVATLVHEGDVCALITTGPSAVEVDYTYDRKRLEAAISRVTGSGLTFADLTTTSEGPSGPADLRRRASAALATVYNAINALDQIHDKRKVVLFVSAGYDFDPFPEARRGTDKVFGGRYGTPARDLIEDTNPFFRSPQITADADLAAQLLEVALAANRTNASIFTIDPRGLVGTTDAGQQIDMTEWSTHLRRTQGSLRMLAERTGGSALLNQNEFEPLLKQVDAATSDYYILGYYSSNPDPTRRVRRIEVRVARPGVTVTARDSYALRPRERAPVPPLRSR